MRPALCDSAPVEAVETPTQRRGPSQLADPAKANSDAPSVDTPKVASAKAAGAAPSKARKVGPLNATRRAKLADGVNALRKIAEPDAWDLTLDQAFKLTVPTRSNGATNASWVATSLRGIPATRKRGCACFAQEQGGVVKIRDITPSDCQAFVEDLGHTPGNWGRSDGLALKLHDLIKLVDDVEEKALLAVEKWAEAEHWCVDDFEETCTDARPSRVEPKTRCKHQTYLSMVHQDRPRSRELRRQLGGSDRRQEDMSQQAEGEATCRERARRRGIPAQPR